jgi:hypothetical protein
MDGPAMELTSFTADHRPYFSTTLFFRAFSELFRAEIGLRR